MSKLSAWEQMGNILFEQVNPDEKITEEEIIEISKASRGCSISKQTFKKLLSESVLIEVEFSMYQLGSYIPKVNTISSKGKKSKKYSLSDFSLDNLPDGEALKDLFDKDHNQDYGGYFEVCVTDRLNNVTQMPEWSHWLAMPIILKMVIWNKSALVADHLRKQYPGISVRIGNHTGGKAKGDILLPDGTILELKWVYDGAATYHGTTIYYLKHYGINFKDYMEKYGLYNVIEKYFPNYIDRKESSPVNNDASKDIRHNYKDIYTTEIVPVNYNMMIYFVKDIQKYFETHPDDFINFINDMFEKKKERGGYQSSMPDRFIYFHYGTNYIGEINLKEFKKQLDTHVDQTRWTDKGFCINNQFRVIFGWQNGNGMNNPTIRVFLEGKEKK